jgi:hypothetical protein
MTSALQYASAVEEQKQKQRREAMENARLLYRQQQEALSGGKEDKKEKERALLSATAGPLTAMTMSSGKEHFPFLDMTKAPQVLRRRLRCSSAERGRNLKERARRRTLDSCPRPPPPQKVVEKEKEYEGDWSLTNVMREPERSRDRPVLRLPTEVSATGVIDCLRLGDKFNVQSFLPARWVDESSADERGKKAPVIPRAVRWRDGGRPRRLLTKLSLELRGKCFSVNRDYHMSPGIHPPFFSSPMVLCSVDSPWPSPTVVTARMTKNSMLSIPYRVTS